MCSRFIATNYWPFPTRSTTHLDIQRICRNLRFRALPREQLEAERRRHIEWAANRPSRTRFNDVAGIVDNEVRRPNDGSDTEVDTEADTGAKARTVDNVAVDQRAAQEAFDEALAREYERRWNEEEDRKLAESLARGTTMLDPPQLLDLEINDLPPILEEWEQQQASNNAFDATTQTTWQITADQLDPDAQPEPQNSSHDMTMQDAPGDEEGAIEIDSPSPPLSPPRRPSPAPTSPTNDVPSVPINWPPQESASPKPADEPPPRDR